MRLAATKAKVVTQMGNQIHSHEAYRTAVKLVHDGVIGKIKEVHSWQRQSRQQIHQHDRRPRRPARCPRTSTGTCGSAPRRWSTYAPDVYHPFKWRDWQDFGAGTMGDFGCHILDPVFTALETHRAHQHPRGEYRRECLDLARHRDDPLRFPGTNGRPDKTLPITWYDGGRQPDLALAQMPADKKLPGAGSLLIGEGGMLIIPHVAMPQLYPQEKFGDLRDPKVAGSSHYHAWVDAALGGAKTTDNFDYAGPLTEAVQLGNVATRCPGVKLEWDAAALRIPNHPAADKLLTKQYRDGWKIKPVG